MFDRIRVSPLVRTIGLLVAAAAISGCSDPEFVQTGKNEQKGSLIFTYVGEPASRKQMFLKFSKEGAMDNNGNKCNAGRFTKGYLLDGGYVVETRCKGSGGGLQEGYTPTGRSLYSLGSRVRSGR